MLAILLNPWARLVLIGAIAFSFGLMKGWDWGSASKKALENKIVQETLIRQAEAVAVNTSIEQQGIADIAELENKNSVLESQLKEARRIITEKEGGECFVSIETVRALNAQRQ